MRILIKTLKPLHDDEYTKEAKYHRRWGVLGHIIDSHDAHGLCYDVLHHDDNTIGSYDPDELELIK